MKERAKAMLEAAKSDADMIISDLDKLCDDATAAVNEDWPNKKLDIVPGSAILDEVYKTFGARYDKMRDGINIASHIQKREIDGELHDFIRGLNATYG